MDEELKSNNWPVKEALLWPYYTVRNLITIGYGLVTTPKESRVTGCIIDPNTLEMHSGYYVPKYAFVIRTMAMLLLGIVLVSAATDESVEIFDFLVDKMLLVALRAYLIGFCIILYAESAGPHPQIETEAEWMSLFHPYTIVQLGSFGALMTAAIRALINLLGS